MSPIRNFRCVQVHTPPAPRDKFHPAMSLYSVQKLLFQLNNDARVSARFDADRAAVLEECALSDVERDAVVTGDVGTLYMMGVAPLLLAPFGGRCGLAWPQYLAALKAARERAAQSR